MSCKSFLVNKFCPKGFECQYEHDYSIITEKDLPLLAAVQSDAIMSIHQMVKKLLVKDSPDHSSKRPDEDKPIKTIFIKLTELNQTVHQLKESIKSKGYPVKISQTSVVANQSEHIDQRGQSSIHERGKTFNKLTEDDQRREQLNVTGTRSEQVTPRKGLGEDALGRSKSLEEIQSDGKDKKSFSEKLKFWTISRQARKIDVERDKKDNDEFEKREGSKGFLTLTLGDPNSREILLKGKEGGPMQFLDLGSSGSNVEEDLTISPIDPPYSSVDDEPLYENI